MTTAPQTDDVVAAIADPQRRFVLSYLADAGQVTLEELALRLTERPTENGLPRTAATRLHHVHLPLLESVGLVDYQREELVAEASELAAEALEDLGEGVLLPQ